VADYDVQPIALSAPPQPAFVTAYRPAVSVRNNGIHEAYAAGIIRIYTAGKLIFTTSLLSGLIAPKATKDALGLEYWTPPGAGSYMAFATITTENDQVPSNDTLAPVTFSVSGLPPPPPPGVTAHAAQHEENAVDEIDLDGMRGVLSDPQTAAAHKTTHQAGGADVLDVTGLPGILADGQPIATHKETHEDDGDDQLNVDGLHGQLYNVQKPDLHDNSAHDPNYTTVTEFGNHLSDTTDVHATAKNLEQKANKGKADGYAGLGPNALVPIAQLAPIPAPGAVRFLRDDQSWGEMLDHAASHETEGTDEISIEGLSGKAADAQTPDSTLAHKTTHETGGDDEISIGGLSGKAADAQTPEAHEHPYQPTSEKAQANGYAPLDGDAKVPTDNLPAFLAAPHKETHEDGGGDELSVDGLSGLTTDPQRKGQLFAIDTGPLIKGNEGEKTITSILVPLAYQPNPFALQIETIGHITSVSGLGGTFTLRLYAGLIMLVERTFEPPPNTTWIQLRSFITTHPGMNAYVGLVLTGERDSGEPFTVVAYNGSISLPPGEFIARVSGQWNDMNEDDHCSIWHSCNHSISGLV